MICEAHHMCNLFCIPWENNLPRGYVGNRKEPRRKKTAHFSISWGKQISVNTHDMSGVHLVNWILGLCPWGLKTLITAGYSNKWFSLTLQHCLRAAFFDTDTITGSSVLIWCDISWWVSFAPLAVAPELVVLLMKGLRYMFASEKQMYFAGMTVTMVEADIDSSASSKCKQNRSFQFRCDDQA